MFCVQKLLVLLERKTFNLLTVSVDDTNTSFNRLSNMTSFLDISSTRLGLSENIKCDQILLFNTNQKTNYSKSNQ